MSRYVHTFKYNKLTNGTRKHKLITFRIWAWGFGITYETKKSIGGFAIADRKNILDVKSDEYRRKHPKA
jgi:hypothetical protein